MPKKVNHSHLMSTSEFFAKWNTWRPLAFKVVISNQLRMPLSASPEFGTNDDVVSFICLEMHRLGIFARFDASRGDDEAKYISSQIKSIIKHKWQDICRLTKAGAPSYLNTSNNAVSSVEPMYAPGEYPRHTLAELPESYAIDFDYSHGVSNPEDKTSLDMAISAIAAALPPAKSDERVPLAVQALNLMRRNPVLASECSTPVLASTLGISKETSRGVRALLAATASAL